MGCVVCTFQSKGGSVEELAEDLAKHHREILKRAEVFIRQELVKPIMVSARPLKKAKARPQGGAEVKRRHTFRMVLTRDGKWYVAGCPELRVASQGRTVASAMKNLVKVITFYLRDVVMTWDETGEKT